MNLTLRGSTYHCRKKVTVGRTTVSMAFSLATGSYGRARSIPYRLCDAAETPRISYGSHIGMTRNKLKGVLSDAVCWKSKRILGDRAGSAAPSADHATINFIYAAV